MAELPTRAEIVSGTGQKKTVNASWGIHNFAIDGFKWTRYIAKVPLEPGQGYKSNSPECTVEEGQFVAYSNQSLLRCEFVNEQQKSTKIFTISLQFDSFVIKTEGDCEEFSIFPELSNEPKLQKNKGFLALTCKKIVNGLQLTVDYSDNFIIRKSQLLEETGKHKNFKVYNIIGAGKLSNIEDLPLNSMTIVNDSTGKPISDLTLKRKSFLLIRQSPFEVDVGLAINQVAYSGTDAAFSAITMRATTAISYRFFGRFLAKFDATADLFSISESAEGDVNTNYSFFEAYQMGGLRLGSSFEFDFLVGLAFARYAYKIEDTQRSFTRQGYTAQLLAKKMFKNQADYWLKLQMRTYANSNDSALSVTFGYRWSRQSKITPWISFDTITLSNQEDSEEVSDTGQIINLGASLDF
tara:strand:- start:160558 stop:161787 length:1230 start_codon:yes stop_codon:yes gene_type:complete